MIDKERIIIDGVNVTQCGFIHPEISKTQCHIALAFSDQYEECTNCEQIEDCYFKQLARKTWECEELISEKDFYLQRIAVLEQEREELKRQKAILKSWSKHLEQWKDSLLKDNDCYRNTLEEIEKELKESFTECKGVFMVNSKLHLICGNCGCNNMWEYEIDMGGKDIDGSLFPEVFINCKNCGTTHTLDEAGAIDKDVQA